MLDLLTEILRNSILITGLVVIMMMMIESLNIESKGMVFKGLRNTKTGQVIIAALLEDSQLFRFIHTVFSVSEPLSRW